MSYEKGKKSSEKFRCLLHLFQKMVLCLGPYYSYFWWNFKKQARIYIFLGPDRLPGRNDVTSDNVGFRPDIRQNYLKKNQEIKSLCGSSNKLGLLHLDNDQT